MPAKRANVEGASGPPPLQPKPCMTSNSLQATFNAAESQPNAAEKVEALTQTFAAAMESPTPPITFPLPMPVESPSPDVPIRGQKTSLEEVPDPDAPKGRPQSHTPGRPILDTVAPPTTNKAANSKAPFNTNFKSTTSKPASPGLSKPSMPSASHNASPAPNWKKNAKKGATPAIVPRKSVGNEDSGGAHGGAKTAPIPSPSSKPISRDEAPYSDEDQFHSAISSRSAQLQPKRSMSTSGRSVFAGIDILADQAVYDELLQAAVARHHKPWDPYGPEPDPLGELGAEDGVIPGRLPEEALMLRDVLIRWAKPDLECTHENILEAVEALQNHKVVDVDFRAYKRGDFEFYSMRIQVVELTRVVVALMQILEALSEYLYAQGSRPCTLDTDYKFVRLLAWHDNVDEMKATWVVLVKRIYLASKHAKRYFNNLRSIFTSFGDVYSNSSYNSTTPTEQD